MNMFLKNQLRFHLERHGMTASALAKKSGVPKQSISGWLAGSNPRDVRQIKRVADILNVSVDNLLFGNGQDKDKQRVTELEAFAGDGWISGLFEIRLRRVNQPKQG
jgi:transcriptional regulator with XRE-family HTH domain